MTLEAIGSEYGKIGQYEIISPGLMSQRHTSRSGLQCDTVEIGNKQKTSTGTKVLIGAGAVAVLAGIAALIAKRGKFSDIPVQQLREHLDFNPEKFKTPEEIIEFAKKNLHINEFSGFEKENCKNPVEVLNWIVRGIVETSNKLKGKIRVPKEIRYFNTEEAETLAGVARNTDKKINGIMIINSNVFENFDAKLNEHLKNLNIKITDNSFEIDSLILPLLSTENLNKLIKLLDKYSSGKATFEEKILLYDRISNLGNKCNSYMNSPLKYIEELLKKTEKYGSLNKELKNIYAGKDLKNLSKEEQAGILFNMFAKIFELMKQKKLPCKIKNLTFQTEFNETPFHTIYHEFGHLQDTFRVHAKGKFENPKDYPKELKEWLDNTEYIETAKTISNYAATGPGEFIAETFAEMIQGKTIPNEVKDLYNKLKGPYVPGY